MSTDVLLSHQDDVADADKYAHRFSARVRIHEDDRSAATYATNVLKGTEMTDIGGNLIAIHLAAAEMSARLRALVDRM